MSALAMIALCSVKTHVCPVARFCYKQVCIMGFSRPSKQIQFRRNPIITRRNNLRVNVCLRGLPNLTEITHRYCCSEERKSEFDFFFSSLGGLIRFDRERAFPKSVTCLQAYGMIDGRLDLHSPCISNTLLRKSEKLQSGPKDQVMAAARCTAVQSPFNQTSRGDN